MLYVVHILMLGVFIALPVVALTVDAIRARRRRKTAPSMPMLVTLIGGVVLGVTLTVVYSIAMKGRASVGQMLLAVYFAFSLLLLLKGFDYVLRAALVKGWMRVASVPITRADRSGTAAISRATTEDFPAEPLSTMPTGLPPPPKRRRRLPRFLDILPALLRIAILFGVALPYVMAVIMTYRPKVIPQTDPMRETGMTFEEVEFRSSDGTKIAGWWIPSQVGRQQVIPSDRTIILCHGLGSGKANMIRVARLFVPRGYNVLLFDFRAHGGSGGQLTSFGDLERRDVLAAARWVKSNRPAQSNKLFGIGASMGASALIMGATESPSGEVFDAIVVYGTFDDLGALGRRISENNFPPPLSWVAGRVGIPLASIQVGRNLSDFRPADRVADLFPRPILVIHGQEDEIIPFPHGQRLFNAAWEPKRQLWLPRGDHNQILESDDVAETVRRFLESARPAPFL